MARKNKDTAAPKKRPAKGNLRQESLGDINFGGFNKTQGDKGNLE